MLKVTCGNNTNRKSVIVDEAATTPREVLEQNGIAYSGCSLIINGVVARAGDADMTFEQLGASGTATVFAMQKTDNAR